MRYQYEDCRWPPQRVTDIGFYNQAFLIFNFGRSLPPSTENRSNSEFRVEWTDELSLKLIKLAPIKSWNELAEIFGITAVATRQKYACLVKQGKAPKLNKTRTWTKEEEAYLLAHYNDPFRELAKAIGKKDYCISSKIRYMKLERITQA